MLFVELNYTLATEEAERIGVDHVARMSTSESSESSTGNNYIINVKGCSLAVSLSIKKLSCAFLITLPCKTRV